MLSLNSNKVPLVLQNPLSAHVTSLPYLDEELNEKSRNYVNQLIKEEMKNMEAIDYLGKIVNNYKILFTNFQIKT